MSSPAGPSPAGPSPTLPYTVAADRAGARRRRRLFFPIMLMGAVLAGAAIGLGIGAVFAGPGSLALACGGVLVVAVVAVRIAYPHTRRPPEGDWLFRLEPDGLRFPPDRRAGPGHPGLLLPWPLVTSLAPRKVNGEPVVTVGVAPEAEAVLLGQGATPPQARLAARRGLHLRLSGGQESPERCQALLVATRAERAGVR